MPSHNKNQILYIFKNKGDSIMTVNFDRLNQQTREYNNTNFDRFNTSTPTNKISAYWQNYYNNQTFKQNNGQYSTHYWQPHGTAKKLSRFFFALQLFCIFQNHFKPHADRQKCPIFQNKILLNIFIPKNKKV